MEPMAIQAGIGALTIPCLLAMVVARTATLRRSGIVATKFGAIDKTDFFIPPFAFFYFYLIFANAFSWPTVTHSRLFASGIAAWTGVALCLGGLTMTAAALAAFGKSFRIGIDTGLPGALVTTGIFAHTRNPIYAAFALVLLGEFLILPHWLMLLYVLAGFALFHRQVLREEAYLVSHYGPEYRAYRDRVRRYV
jgi:protein-S-isoprenylcysteine O-methyltransferase Ste14